MALVLYEILAGRSPFHDATGAEAIARAQLGRTPAPIAGVPSGLMSILRRALAKNPDERPRDAFAFARELQEIESFLPGDKSLGRSVIAARAACDDPMRQQQADVTM